jgi:RimJ/RimL family protein N-acetyltransferase
MAPDLSDFELRTERLLLRRHREDDLDRLAEIRSLDEVKRYLYGDPETREQVAEKLASRISSTRLEEDDDWVVLAVERLDDGLLLGDVTIYQRSVEHRQAEVGWIFHPDAGGHGYATEASRALIDWAFKELGSHRVFARTDARNLPSAALCRRLGMREEAHLRENEIFKGEWGEERIFAILDREWPPAADPA